MPWLCHCIIICTHYQYAMRLLLGHFRRQDCTTLSYCKILPTSHSRQRRNFLYDHQWYVVTQSVLPKAFSAQQPSMFTLNFVKGLVYPSVDVYYTIIVINKTFRRWSSLWTISQHWSHDYCQWCLAKACPSHNGRTQRQASAHQ